MSHDHDRKRAVPRWHILHTWTRWVMGDVDVRRAFEASYSTTACQMRQCVHCGKRQVRMFNP